MSRRLAENVALFVLLAVVGLRPLVVESFSTAEVRLTAALEGITDPWASATLVIDVVVLVVAGGLLLMRMVGPGRSYRPAGIELGAGLLVLAAIVSCLAADHKRPALNASLDLLAVLVLTLALVQLLDAGWKQRLALVVIVASGLANAAECFEQSTVGFSETQAHYESIREQLWTRQGISLDSPRVALFEKRMLSNEANGHFSHSNVAGGYLLLAGFAALGLALGGLRSGGRRALLALIWLVSAGAIAVAVFLTRSVGGLAAGVAALVLLAVRSWLPSGFESHRRAVFVGGWVLVAVAVVGVVVFGVVRGGLPGASLNFRWQYWTASADMFSRSGLTGVGAENFGDSYLRYKSIESPEEVKNPHNFIAQFATEYGALGLLAVLAMLVGGSWSATRTTSVPARSAEHGLQDSGSVRSLAVWGAALALAVFLPRIALLPSRDPNLIVWATSIPLMAWILAFAPLVIEPGSGGRSSVGRPMLAVVINCGLFAFLLQDTVNFALFVPGARTAFFALLAVSIALGHGSLGAAGSSALEPADSRPKRSRRRRDVTPSGPAAWPPVVGYVLFVAALIYSVSGPIHAEVAVRRARACADEPAPTVETHPAHAYYVRATRLDPLDASIPAEHAAWLERAALTSSVPAQASTLDLALGAVATALDRAPGRGFTWHLKTKLHLLKGGPTDDGAEYGAAVRALRRFLELYPNRPQTYVELGDCLMLIGTPEKISEAIDNFQHALELDSHRPTWELFAGFTDAQKSGIEERIESARNLLRTQTPVE